MKSSKPTPVPAPTRALPLQQEIAALAYEIWDKRGRPEGCALDHWLEAEGQILGTDPNTSHQPGGAVAAQPLAQAVSGNRRQPHSGDQPELTTNTSR